MTCVEYGGHVWTFKGPFQFSTPSNSMISSENSIPSVICTTGKSATIYTFPNIERFIPIFGGTTHGCLSRILWCPWGWHWGMVPVLVAKLLFHHQRSTCSADTYPVDHYHKGMCVLLCLRVVVAVWLLGHVFFPFLTLSSSFLKSFAPIIKVWKLKNFVHCKSFSIVTMRVCRRCTCECGGWLM
jgi:hypothetical protein